MKLTSNKSPSTDSNVFRKALEKYLETLIALKGNAWCMDVRSERRLMSRLVAGVVANAITLEGELHRVSPKEVFIRCTCKRGLALQLRTGERDSYSARCNCQKGWFLTDWPASLPF